jgi:hypothetical protein
MWSRAEVLSDPSVVPDTSGIYGWHFRDVPAAELLTGCVQRHGLSLLYVGIAPKHASSASTMRKRIVENHFKARRGLSTLPLTLALLLGLETRHTKSCNVVPTPQSQQRLSEWMSDHAFVVWTAAKAPWTLEKLVISQLRPPLTCWVPTALSRSTITSKACAMPLGPAGAEPTLINVLSEGL